MAPFPRRFCWIVIGMLAVGLSPGSARSDDEKRDADPGPIVRSKAKADAERRPSTIPPLGPSASPSYDPDAPDWSALPPWRRTAFFGVRAQGQTFVYVVDCSGSMADEFRLVRAKRELRRSVMELRFPQRFHVIFFNHQPIAMPGGLPQSADHTSKSRFWSWLRQIEPDGGTDPRAAMKLALALRPDAIFLLSDGILPEGVADEIVQLNTRKIPVHCIDLTGGAGGDDLKRIAQESGGQYAAR